MPGALAATAGLTLLSYGLLRTADEPLTAPGTALPVLAGLAALTGFTLVELRSMTPLVPPAFFRPARRTVALVAILATAGAMATTFLVLSLHLQQVRALSPLWTSMVFLPFGVAQIGTGMVTARLVHRCGTAPVTAVGLFAATAGTLLLGLALGAGGPVWTVVLGLLPLGFGVATAFAGAVVGVVDGVPDHQAGLAAGVANTMMEAGPTLGTAAFLALGAAVHAQAAPERGEPAATVAGHAASFTAMAGTLLAAGLLTTLLALRTVVRRRATTPAQP